MTIHTNIICRVEIDKTKMTLGEIAAAISGNRRCSDGCCSMVV